ncbi:MAG: Mov34/MPN/PAD-1 family protein [Luteimonas sp.]
MIQWKAVQPDSMAKDLTGALARLSFVDALAIASTLLKGPLVLFEPEARASILNHVSARREESGGLLLGEAFVPSNLTAPVQFPVVIISKAVPSHEYHGTSVSLHMGPSVWESVRTEIGLLVVGWFHSHPNLGAFFSGTDRKTQREFFYHEYSIGYVVDPVRDDHAYFIGEDAAQISSEHVLDVTTCVASRAMSEYK